jgi:hypothetical protein
MNLNLSIMKQVNILLSLSGRIKAGSLLTVTAILWCVGAQAQTARPALKPTIQLATAPPAKPPVTQTKAVVKESPAKEPLARNMKEYARTAKGIERAKKHAKATSAVLTKYIKYNHGPGATLTMVKNPSFGQTSNVKVPPQHPVKKDSTGHDGAKWVCTTEHVSLDANSTSFLCNDYSAAISHIYPGAIFTFDAIASGTYNEQPGARYPITISTDNPNINGSGQVTVPDPNMGTVRAAVAQLFRESVGPPATESQASQIFQNYNSAVSNISVYGFASYAGASASDAYSNQTSSNSITITIDDRKSLFTINTIPPDSGFFKNASLEEDPSLMVIGNVSYGIRVLANLTVTFNSSQEENDFKAAYSGFGADVNAAVHYLSASKSVQSTINCYVVGGPGNSTLSFDKKELEKQLAQLIAGVNYQNARPVSYQFYDMAGNVMGAQSATDQFQENSCVPASTAKAKLKSVYAKFKNQTGKRGDDHYHIFLYANDPVSAQAGGYDNFNGTDPGPNGATQTDPSLYSYETGALNVDYQVGQSNTVELTANPKFGAYYGAKKPEVTLGFLMDYGGVVHLHIYPNGNDTWTISELDLELNFEDGVTKPVVFKNITLAQYSTEATLYFDGSFNQK